MVRYNQEFKKQAVEKALSRQRDVTLKDIAEQLQVGYSTLYKWIAQAKDKKLMSGEKGPQNWTKAQRLEAIMRCYGLNEEQISAYCRENGIYPHNLKTWKEEFASEEKEETLSKQEQKKLRKENKRLKSELNRKEKALSETAALLVLSKKCQAIWGAKEED